MKLEFYKYHGTGNDFVMINGFEQKGAQNLSQVQIKEICDRHFGIGGDGLIILAPHEDYDFEMIYYNSDGNRSTMCGNGGRCILKMATNLGLVNKDKIIFLAVDGPHNGRVHGDLVSLKMSDVTQIENIGNGVELNTGSPHYVRVVKELSDYNIVEFGKYVRYSDRYKEEGINVNLVESRDGELAMQTYERGVEDETLSCGTGVTAAALTAAFFLDEYKDNKVIAIKTKGGDLSVSFERSEDGFNSIWLSGPAKEVFSGSYNVR